MRKLFKFIPYLFLFSLSFIPFLWLNGKSIILGYDGVFPLSPIPFLLNRIFSWSSDVNFGMDQSGFQGSLIIHFIDAIPSFFGAGVQFSEKIVFSFWFFLILLSAFLLGLKLEKEKLVDSPFFKYIFAIIYAFNFYVLQAWWIIERTKFSLMVATPLILSLFIPHVLRQSAKREIFKTSFISAFILTVFNGGGWIGLPLYGGLLVTLFSFYIFFFLIYYLQNRKRQIFNLTLLLISFFLFFFLLNSYTLIPFLFTTLKEYGAQLQGAGGISGVVEWSRYISENTSILNLLRLQGIPDWYNNGLAHPYSPLYLSNPIFIAASFVFPLFLIFAVYKKKRAVISFFLFLLITSLFFTAGSHKPLNFLFDFMIRYIPGFAIFRSPFFKFGYSYWLAASVLIAYSLSFFIDFLLSKITIKNRKIFGFLLSLMAITLILIYHFPYFTGDFFRTSTTNFSSKVTIPSYVYGFARWWNNTPNQDRILLLPKLNSNWLFEQYRWKYLSLFPLLQNMALPGIVENTDNLSSQERILLDKLYEAINLGDYKTMDRLSSILGIRYFLVRNDFDYSYRDQETDNTGLIKEKLAGNSGIRQVKNFGEWEAFSYTDQKPIFYTQNYATVSNEPENSIDKSASRVFISEASKESKNTIGEKQIVPECISCKAERIDIDVRVPEPKILMDSPVYEILNFRSGKTHDIYSLLGESLKMEGQVIQIILQEKDQSLIDLSSREYIKVLKKIYDEASKLSMTSNEAYVVSIKSQQYLNEEYSSLSDLLSKVSSGNIRADLEKDLYSIVNAREKFASFYGEDDFNTKKIFKFDVLDSGIYSLKVSIRSLGNIDSMQLDNSTINYKGEELKASVSDSYLDFGKVKVSKGDNFFVMNLTRQKNILSTPVKQEIAGNTCFSSYVNDFSLDNAYQISFKWKNNFDSNFIYFIDAGQSFNPISIEHLPLSGEQIKDKKIIVSGLMPFPRNTDKMRIGICSPSMSEDIYNQNIKDLSGVLLINPLVFVSSDLTHGPSGHPAISFSKIDQAHFRVNVQKNDNPFYIVFAERFSTGWKSNEGEHMIANNFENAWYIDRKGDFTMDIKYDPQNYFNLGLLISILTLGACVIFLVRRRKNG